LLLRSSCTTFRATAECCVEKLIHFVPEPQQRRYVCRYNLLLYFPELRRSEMFVEDMFVEAMLAEDILPAILYDNNLTFIRFFIIFLFWNPPYKKDIYV